MSNAIRYTAALAALLALAACASSPKPDRIIASVSPGLTQSELMKRIGPPDRVYDDSGNECFEYALGDNDVPLAVYFDAQGRVATSARAACKGRLR